MAKKAEATRQPQVGDKVRYGKGEGYVVAVEDGKAVIEVVYPAISEEHAPYTWNSGEGLEADKYEVVTEDEQA